MDQISPHVNFVTILISFLTTSNNNFSIFHLISYSNETFNCICSILLIFKIKKIQQCKILPIIVLMRLRLGIAEINIKKNYEIFPNRFLTLYLKSNSCILITTVYESVVMLVKILQNVVVGK